MEINENQEITPIMENKKKRYVKPLIITGSVVIIIVFAWLVYSLISLQSQNPNNINDRSESGQLNEDSNDKNDKIVLEPQYLKDGTIRKLQSQDEIRSFLLNIEKESKSTKSFLKTLQETDVDNLSEDELPMLIKTELNKDGLGRILNEAYDLYYEAEKKMFIKTSSIEWYGYLDQENRQVIFNEVGNEELIKTFNVSQGIPHSFILFENHLYVFGTAEDFYESTKYKDYLRNNAYSFVEVFDIGRSVNGVSNNTYLLEGNLEDAYVLNNRLHIETNISDYKYFEAETLLPRLLINDKAISAVNPQVNGFDIEYNQINILSHLTLDLEKGSSPAFTGQYFFLNGNEIKNLQLDQLSIVLNKELNLELLEQKIKYDLLFNQFSQSLKEKYRSVISSPIYLLSNYEKQFKLDNLFDEHLNTLDSFSRSEFIKRIDSEVASTIADKQVEIEKSVLHNFTLRKENYGNSESHSISGYVLYDDSIGIIDYPGTFNFNNIIFSQTGLLNSFIPKSYNSEKKLKQNKKVISSVLHNNELLHQDSEIANEGLHFSFLDRFVVQYTKDGINISTDYYALDSQGAGVEFGIFKSGKISKDYEYILLSGDGFTEFGLRKNLFNDQNGVISQDGLVIDDLSMFYDFKPVQSLKILSGNAKFSLNSELNKVYFDTEHGYLYLPVFRDLKDYGNKNLISIINVKDFTQEALVSYGNESIKIDSHSFAHEGLIRPDVLTDFTNGQIAEISLITQKVDSIIEF